MGRPLLRFHNPGHFHEGFFPYLVKIGLRDSLLKYRLQNAVPFSQYDKGNVSHIPDIHNRAVYFYFLPRLPICQKTLKLQNFFFFHSC